ncbi:hypothetical protein AB0D66_21055 [Streptomyces sp. NPDC048270]|uniref:hypothetical protein n=1 Tax=Streptomyces sp. NPDC048270 TaxID=3154615 RepID=UPI0033DE6D94
MTEPDGTTATATATASRPEAAWPLENILFSAALVARRLPWADLPARTLGLEALTREGLTRRLTTHLRGGREGRPVRLRTPFGTFVVPLTRAGAEGLLAGADGAGALGPASGLAADGRRYTLSPHAAPAGAWDVPARDELDGLTARVSEQLVQVLAARREDGTLDPARWHDGMLRLSRHVVLGAGAAEDTLLSELVSSAGATGGRRHEASRAAAVRRRLEPYLADPEPGSLADRLTARGQADPESHLAVAHALALVSTATSASALHALALLGAGAGAGAAGAGSEEDPDAVAAALDRYPPLSAVVYPVRAPFEADGAALRAGEEVLYLPALWGARAGGARTDASRSLCANPAGCALARFAALVCGAVVRGITAEARPVLLAPRFTADRLPDVLDPRTVAVALTAAPGPGAAQAGHGASSAGPAGAAPLSGYGVLGHAGADRLEGHAESLAACAADTGWNGSEAGERFRMVLLSHADRCARAAADVRSAARRLSG